MDLTRHLTNLYLLVRVIDAGGFSAAAREIGTTRSLLSRRIIALEEALDVRLLYRDARRFTVTATGEKVYRHAVMMCDAAQAATAAARESRGTGHGKLRVSMCDALLPLISGVLAAFAGHHPQMQLSANTRHDVDALLLQRTDVIFHLGHTLPDSGDIVARPLGQARLVIVANPDLLQRLSHPRHPDEIDASYLLGYTGHGLSPDWALRGSTSKRQPARLVSDHLATVIEAAQSGMGLVQLPMYACHEDLASGRLELAFEAFEASPQPLHALTLSGHACDEATLDFIRFTRGQLADMRNRGVLPM